MSDFMGDLSVYLSAGNASTLAAAKSGSNNMGLDMTDFLTLMVTELTNQSIDQTADTSEMLNQMVQMQMITAITNLTDASIMTYAASLVGKEVTVGQYDEAGNLLEIVGEVTGTGTMGGEQVVFVGDKYYYMSEIMAVGRLPEIETPGEEGAETGKVEGVDGTGSDGQVEDTEGTDTGGDSAEEPEAAETAAPEDAEA